MLASLRASLTRRIAWPPGILVVAVCYIFAYLADPSLPGNGSKPDGWFAWSDQKHYWDSATALHWRNLDPDQHWYPLGYSLLAAPFARLLRNQMFFPVDLLSLLVSYWAFIAFVRRLGFSSVVAIVAFLPILLSTDLRRSWVEPWNTTASTALIWLLLASVAAHLAENRSAMRLIAIGALAGGIAAIRPTDAGVATLCIAVAAVHDLVQRRARFADAALLLVGALSIAAPYAALHLAIYGWHPSPYFLVSQQVGFAFDDIGFKAFVLLQEPSMWFGTGEGILRRFPWICLAAAGAMPALVSVSGPRRWALAALIAALAWHYTLYLSYIDLLPPSLWSFGAVHYFKWTFPALALLALLFLKNLWNGRRGWAVGGLALTSLVASLRLTPAPAKIGDPAKMIELLGPTASWKQAYQGDFLIKDDIGQLPSFTAARAMPSQDGIRVIGLRRNLVGSLSFQDDRFGPVAGQSHFMPRLEWGWPCFLYPYPCAAKKPLQPNFD